jgi:phosphatidylinositol alpha-1,6-mannosyltransferase
VVSRTPSRRLDAVALPAGTPRPQPSTPAPEGPAEQTPLTLVVTNDFPPTFGGVQQYVFNLVANLPPDRITVLAPAAAGARQFDDAQGFEVVRDTDSSLKPSHRVAEKVRSLIRSRDIDVVVFGHALPLALLGPGIAKRGTPYVVCTHGREYWMALLPGTTEALRWATSRASRVFAITRATARSISSAVPGHVPVSLLPPGVDVERFHPGAKAGDVRSRHALGDGPLILAPSRLVPRKGHDVLLRAMPRLIQDADANLLIVGQGPHERRLRELASVLPPGRVTFAGAVPDAILPQYYAEADIVAVPCRSRYLGLEIEGFGIVYLEAAASGKPAIAGRSGGTDEAVVDGVTGLLVDGSSAESVAEAVRRLLCNPEASAAMGRAGRERAERLFAWPRLSYWFGRVLREAAAWPESGVRSLVTRR